MIYSIAICDDKESEIEAVLKEFDKVFLRYSANKDVRFERYKYTDPNELIEVYRDKKHDLILLDIEMPIMNGFSVAEALTAISPLVKIVFVTSHDHFIFDSLQYMPLEFIRKSQLFYDLERKSDYIFSKIQKDEALFTITQKNGNIQLNLFDIIYIENVRNDVSIYMENGKDYKVVRKTLENFVRELNHDNIIQISRSYAINIAFVREPPRRDAVKLIKNGNELPVGDKFKNGLFEKFMEYSGGFNNI